MKPLPQLFADVAQDFLRIWWGNISKERLVSDVTEAYIPHIDNHSKDNHVVLYP